MMIQFVIATLLISILPGPSMLLVIMNTLKKGLRQGFMTILGVLAADTLLLGLTFISLAGSLGSSVEIFSTIKWLGAVYLIYLGVMELKSKIVQKELNGVISGQSVYQGIVVTLCNPKILLFLVAFFPPFIMPEKSLMPQFLTLAPLFILTVFIILLAYSLCASKAKNLMETKLGQKIIKLITGLSLIGFGLAAAVYQG